MFGVISALGAFGEKGVDEVTIGLPYSTFFSEFLERESSSGVDEGKGAILSSIFWSDEKAEYLCTSRKSVMFFLFLNSECPPFTGFRVFDGKVSVVYGFEIEIRTEDIKLGVEHGVDLLSSHLGLL